MLELAFIVYYWLSNKSPTGWSAVNTPHFSLSWHIFQDFNRRNKKLSLNGFENSLDEFLGLAFPLLLLLFNDCKWRVHGRPLNSVFFFYFKIFPNFLMWRIIVGWFTLKKSSSPFTAPNLIVDLSYLMAYTPSWLSDLKWASNFWHIFSYLTLFQKYFRDCEKPFEISAFSRKMFY